MNSTAPSLAFLILVVATLLLANTSWSQPLVEGEVQTVNQSVDTFELPNVDSVVASTNSIGRTGASFVRLHFEEIQDQSEVPYRIRITGQGKTLAEIPQSEFGTRERMWTGILRSDRVVVQVLAEAPPVGLSFHIAEVVIQKRGLILQSIKGEDDSEPLLETGDGNLIAAAASVAKVVYVEGSAAKSCTGFLLDSRHLITNQHCVASQKTCDSALAIFGFVQQPDHSVSPGFGRGCLRVVDTSWPLDASILELDMPPGNDEPTGLDLEPRSLRKHEPLILLHHAAGEPLRVTRRRCRVEVAVLAGRSTETDLGHFCDTQGGSSGSPVLSATSGQVVGLHHWGFEQGVRDTKNQAVRMEELEAFVSAALPAATASNGGTP